VRIKTISAISKILAAEKETRSIILRHRDVGWMGGWLIFYHVWGLFLPYVTSQLSPRIYFVTRLGVHTALNTKWYMFLITGILSAVGLHTWTSAAELRLRLSVKSTMFLARFREVVRATISFVRPPVCSSWNNSAPMGRFLWNLKF